MRKQTKKFENHSPHLEIVAANFFPPTDARLIMDALDFAIRFGGKVELDFTRPVDASFNPRPARVALILINDAKVRDTNIIIAGVLASVGKKELAEIENKEAFPNSALELALNAIDLISQIPNMNQNNDKIILTVSAAHWLDRIRHLHQSPHIERWHELHAQTQTFLGIMGEANPPLSQLINAWYKRFERKLIPLRTFNNGHSFPSRD